MNHVEGYLGKASWAEVIAGTKALGLGYVWHILGTLRRSVWLEWNDQWGKYQFAVFFLACIPSFP